MIIAKRVEVVLVLYALAQSAEAGEPRIDVQAMGPATVSKLIGLHSFTPSRPCAGAEPLLE
jgi:hypothetical protein